MRYLRNPYLVMVALLVLFHKKTQKASLGFLENILIFLGILDSLNLPYLAWNCFAI